MRTNVNKGQGLVEYALIIVLVAVGSILAVESLGGAVNGSLLSSAESIGNPAATASNQWQVTVPPPPQSFTTGDGPTP